jgi:hypothetical protein
MSQMAKLLMTLLMSYALSARVVGLLVDAKTVHQQKKGPNLTKFISKTSCVQGRTTRHGTLPGRDRLVLFRSGSSR